MTAWKIYDYFPQSGLNPVGDWYDSQLDEVQAEFDTSIKFFSATDDWEPYGVRSLEGKYLGLQELVLQIDLEDGEVHFGIIGKWISESQKFVLFLVCNRYNDRYFSCLDKALEYSKAWDRGDPKGAIYEHLG